MTEMKKKKKNEENEENDDWDITTASGGEHRETVGFSWKMHNQSNIHLSDETTVMQREKERKKKAVMYVNEIKKNERPVRVRVIRLNTDLSHTENAEQNVTEQ